MSRKKARLQVVVKIGGVWFFLGIKVISYIDGYSSYQANLRKTMCTNGAVQSSYLRTSSLESTHMVGCLCLAGEKGEICLCRLVGR